MADDLEVGGLRDLIRTFRELEPALARTMRAELKEVGIPVQEQAQRNVGAEITNILSPTAEVDWWQMRIGMTTAGGVVYVAPQQRGTRDPARKRKNLAALLEKQMDAALEQKTPEVIALMRTLVDRLIARYG